MILYWRKKELVKVTSVWWGSAADGSSATPLTLHRVCNTSVAWTHRCTVALQVNMGVLWDLRINPWLTVRVLRPAPLWTLRTNRPMVLVRGPAYAGKPRLPPLLTERRLFSSLGEIFTLQPIALNCLLKSRISLLFHSYVCGGVCSVSSCGPHRERIIKASSVNFSSLFKERGWVQLNSFSKLTLLAATCLHNLPTVSGRFEWSPRGIGVSSPRSQLDPIGAWGEPDSAAADVVAAVSRIAHA